MTANSTSAMTLTMPSDREIVLTRVFDAPRRLVFEAHSKAEHLRRWWGPRGYTLTTCEIDFRAGGAWRFVSRDPEGNEYPFKGEFREITPPERIVWTFIFDVEPFSSHESIETLVLTDENGRTTLTATAVYASPEARDAILQSGMGTGAAETYDRLAEHLATMS